MDRHEVESIIQETVGDTLDKTLSRITSHQCPIPEDAAPELRHLLGVLVDLGEGDMRKGIEVVRDHGKFVDGLMKTKNKMTAIIATSIIVSLVASFLALLGFAVKEAIKQLFDK